MQKREKGYSLDVNAGDFAVLEKKNKKVITVELRLTKPSL